MNKEQIKKFILNNDVEKYPLLNEIFAIRDTRKEQVDYTIYVDGYISVDVLNKTLKQQEELEKKDYKIHIMKAEFERLENIEDNTDMLKLELKKKDKVIEELVDKIYKMDYRNEYGNTRNQIKENFYKKVEGK